MEQIGKKFGTFEALKQIDLEVETGEFIAILGPSGCGKTTLLRLLAGFLSPTDGQISIEEEEVGNRNRSVPPEKRNIGMVFQQFALWPHLNVEEHIKFPLEHHRFCRKMSTSEKKKRVEEVLDIVELNLFKKRMPQALSGGQKQRVALARAIAPSPALLLMDEPLSNLDAELRMEMRKEIQALHRLTKATIIYVTHDQGEALAMADRIVVMNKGEIEQVGTPKEIYTKPTSTFVASFVGKANLLKGEWKEDTFIPGLNKALRFNGEAVTKEMKAKGLYPVRPEQFQVLPSDANNEGIPAVITSVQYQGKEIHYTVQAEQGEWTVHTDMFSNFSLGDQIFLTLENSFREKEAYRRPQLVRQS